VLQSEAAQRREEQSRAEALEKRVAEFSKELAAKVADRKSWQQRESELEQCVSAQKRQLADSATAARTQAEELNRLKSTVDDLQVIQSALCARVREMSSHFDTASRRLQELDDRYQAAAQMIQSRDQEFAILRQAIAEAASGESDTDGEHSAVE
jgi:chromosome segregation ATPase